MTTDKLTSRKFIVWIVWLIITIGVVVVSVIRNTGDDLISTVIQDFFYVSMLYLGMNVTQKGAFAIADALKGKEEEKDE